MNIGGFVYRRRWHILLLWLAATAALMLLVLLMPGRDSMSGLTTDPVPADSPSKKALVELAERFGDKSGLGQAVVVFERTDGPLTPKDLDDIERLGVLLLIRAYIV